MSFRGAEESSDLRFCERRFTVDELLPSACVDLPATRRYSPDSSRQSLSMDMIKAHQGRQGDILPEETPQWRFIEDAARRWALCYGYQEIRIPIFELTALLPGASVRRQISSRRRCTPSPDRDGTSLSLRPEGTAGTVRAFIEHNRAADPLPQKYFYIGPMFRHERPQAGAPAVPSIRCRIFGTSDPRAATSKSLQLLWRSAIGSGSPDLTLEINSLGSSGRPRCL